MPGNTLHSEAPGPSLPLGIKDGNNGYPDLLPNPFKPLQHAIACILVMVSPANPSLLGVVSPVLSTGYPLVIVPQGSGEAFFLVMQ
jgi:hypothetical protein